MSHLSYEDQKKSVIVGLIVLAVITAVELFLALVLKHHLNLMLVGFLMIIFSLAKAWYIVMKFMHLGDETKSVRRTVLVPLVVLIWGIIAFLSDGAAWGHGRVKQNYSTRYEQTVVQPVNSKGDLPAKEIH